jgi:hypothetical protein
MPTTPTLRFLVGVEVHDVGLQGVMIECFMTGGGDVILDDVSWH